MKQIFILNIHSFSDVITNSSTDIFACKMDKSQEATEELLSKLLQAVDRTIEDTLTVRVGTVEEFVEECKWYLDRDGEASPKQFIKERGHWLNVTKPSDKILIICGIGDNSIPYWLQEFIDCELGGYRIHLG